MFSNKIIDGKKIAREILQEVRSQIATMKKKPSLAGILIGEDPSSHLYVKLKKKACDFCQINFHRYLFEQDCTEQEIIDVIDFLNKDKETTGILVQLPLPPKFSAQKIIKKISVTKDIDGFHPQNLNKLTGDPTKIYSPLILGVMELLKSTGEPLNNKKVTILCNHEIFGVPFIDLFDKSNELSITTLNDQNYLEKVQSADILIVSIGKPKFIGIKEIKKDSIIIDIGINKLAGQIVGDVDFEQVLPKVKYITPVPGGVGPMTIAMLLQNIVKMSQK